MKILFMVAGTLLICDALLVASVVSVNTGVIAAFAVGVVYLLYGLFHERIRARTGSGPPRVLRIALLVANAAIILAISSVAALGRVDTVSYDEDAVIVLGTAIKDEAVTPALQERLETAVAYHGANPDALVVVSGGQGPGESVTEALAMRRFLVSRGIPESAILMEGRSTSTHENFVLTKSLLDARLGERYTTVFVTNDYHVLRANELSRIAGLDSTSLHAATPWYTVPVDYVRESLAVVKLLLLRE
ncbi:YdcF family protein [Promicromonospora kroppenstedtii]|uniref:YdcF family protein n=1 Tax=Promicromonospora kroppenstedtii TaxID=440482 RepID=UPI0004B4D392|nr:YdcF family protein [Promicromonospora kroppenstedtii]